MRRFVLLCALGFLAAIAGFTVAGGPGPGWANEPITIDSYDVVDDQTLLLHFFSGDASCWRNVEIDTTETVDAVVVSVTQQRKSETDFCTLSARIHFDEIGLDAALGDRAVIDGATGHPITQRV